MSITRDLKKLFVCSASLAIIVGLGSGISNASARRIHHSIKTHKVIKRGRHGKRFTRNHKHIRKYTRRNHKHAHNKKRHLSYYAKGYKLGKENLETHTYESVAADTFDPTIMKNIYKTNMNKQLIRGLFKGLHAHISDGYRYFTQKAISSTKTDIRNARKLSHQRSSLSRKGINDAFNYKLNKRYRHNKTYMRANNLATKLMYGL